MLLMAAKCPCMGMSSHRVGRRILARLPRKASYRDSVAEGAIAAGQAAPKAEGPALGRMKVIGMGVKISGVVMISWNGMSQALLSLYPKPCTQQV